MLALSASMSQAQEKNSRSSKQIKYQVEMDSSGYPTMFDGEGTVDLISEDYVVINDTQWAMTKDTKFNRPKSFNLGVADLKVGDYVGFLKDEKGRLESLWWLRSR